MTGLALGVAAVSAAAMGGVFFAFSTFVMRALGWLPPAPGMAAMQQINRAAPTPWFMVPLFGTAVVGVGAAVGAAGEPGATLAVAGAVVYLAGLVLTIAYHVPRNEALDRLDAASPASEPAWSTYLRTWTAANHLRTLTCLAAAAAWVVALRERAGR
ncbi:MAG TPA: anthrone oxygenase family protein [Acidimicrobiales bacterium]|nr:anthrone oxygenase family protein [Acidimicrobiales bacterium]